MCKALRAAGQRGSGRDRVALEQSSSPWVVKALLLDRERELAELGLASGFDQERLNI